MSHLLDDPKNLPAFRRAVTSWFRRRARDLPFRKTNDPYRVWLAEVIFQQTRIDQGLPYYERFVAAFPTVEALAAAPEDDVLKLWEGLGYYARARNLHRAAEAVAHDHGGVFPRTVEGLQALPGVGPYTARAVASIAYGTPVAVLDGNVKRVLSRVSDMGERIDTAAGQRRLWELAGALVSPRSPGDFNQGMMELGARVCLPRGPACGVCPIRRHCLARAAGTQEERPVQAKKKAAPTKIIAVAVIRRDGRYLIGKRPQRGLLGGLWEFPGGKVEAGESHAQALRRECREELGVTVRVGGLVAEVSHAYSHFKVRLSVYACALEQGEPQPRAHDALAWAAPEAFGRYAFPKANHKFLHLLG
jgi:A/G-specific adenine glycosylase